MASLTEFVILIFFFIIFSIFGLIAYLLSPAYIKIAIAFGAAAFFILLLLAVTGLNKRLR
ncbi:hypothetical protein [Sulfolobus super-elliptical virus]|nr:hypothetical protein [Sulfolobus super-elliptical virus]